MSERSATQPVAFKPPNRGDPVGRPPGRCGKRQAWGATNERRGVLARIP